VVSKVLWVAWTSFRRNWFKYWLAIFGLAAAVAVSCVGITSTALLARMAKYPTLQYIGGDFMVLDRDVNFSGGNGSLSSDTPKPFPYKEAEDVIKNALPEAQVTKTLAPPALHETNRRALTQTLLGREDNTRKWIYSVTMQGGRGLESQDEGALSIVAAGGLGTDGMNGYTEEKVGSTRVIHLPVYQDGRFSSIGAGTRSSFEIIGLYDNPSHEHAVTSLQTVEELTGAHGMASWVGVVLANPLMAGEQEAALEKALAEHLPTLQVVTSDELAEIMLGGFADLTRTVVYYTPVMILISVIIVVVTALAISQSRRRELILLRTIGLSGSQVKALFIAECTAVALVGALLGTGVSLMFGWLLFQAYVVTLAPAGIAVVVTLAVTWVVASGSKGHQFTELLRNP